MLFNAIILGAGAAGLMAAIEAGKRGLKVLVLDHAPEAGQKLLVSGGGKCNVTNRQISWKNYTGEHPEFCKTALQRFKIENTLQILREAHIDIEERDHGRIFCRQGARALVDFLVHTAHHYGADIRLNTSIDQISKQESLFTVNSSSGAYAAPTLLVATGGLAWPQIGASNIGHKIGKQFGHRIIPARPALVGFKLAAKSAFRNLQGISIEVEAYVSKEFYVREPLLFTHRGLSGPAMLQLSCTWEKEKAIVINFLPETDAGALLLRYENGKLLVKTLFAPWIPERLLQAILPETLLRKQVSVLQKSERQAIISQIHAFEEIPIGTEDFSRAETTRGGIDTIQLNPKTMESLLCPRLFFAGELVDLAGQLGGYNIHWAFASGFLAGKNFS